MLTKFWTLYYKITRTTTNAHTQPGTPSGFWVKRQSRKDIKMQSKKFHIGDLITIVTGVLLCHKSEERLYRLDGVYEILDFMSGESLGWYELPSVSDECKPVLLAKYPWLADITFPGYPENINDDDRDDWLASWLNQISEKYGEYHDVFPLFKE